MRSWKILVLSTVTLCAWTAYAHDGHAHRILGTVTALDSQAVSVTGADGKTVSVRLEAGTTYRQGDAATDASHLKVGDRVAIEATGDEGDLTAKTVRLSSSGASSSSHHDPDATGGAHSSHGHGAAGGTH